MAPKISIVMAYYNRKPQLLFTLKTIQDSVYKNCEIIIVNDASSEEHSLEDVQKENFGDLDIKIINIKKEEKTWVNPCIAYNIGVKHATGEIILLQNPEVCHVGDCLTFVSENLQKGDWMTFNCYGLDDHSETAVVQKIYNESETKLSSIFEYVNDKNFKRGGSHTFNSCPGGWLNHYEKHFVAFHYLAAIYKSDLFEKMEGGFCEEYKDGICYDDNDFIKYLVHHKFIFKIPEFISTRPFCIHQYHEKADSLSNLNHYYHNGYVFEKRMQQINTSTSYNLEEFMPKPVVL
jgi:glycosyltransferase involved in cell wall biosynthesis